jgi:hypothetical protein
MMSNDQPHAEQAQTPARSSTRRLLVLPRLGDDPHAAVHVNVETGTARSGRDYARIRVREIAKRGTREIELAPAELRTVAAALTRAAAEIERARAGR